MKLSFLYICPFLHMMSVYFCLLFCLFSFKGGRSLQGGSRGNAKRVPKKRSAPKNLEPSGCSRGFLGFLAPFYRIYQAFYLFVTKCYLWLVMTTQRHYPWRCIYKGANITVGLTRDHRLFILVREYMYRYTTYCKHNSSNKDI